MHFKEEAQQYKKRFDQAIYLGPFHGNEHVTSLTGTGEYALYHGNLEVAENKEAAIYLCEKIFNGLSVKLVIAGNKPSNELRNMISGHPNIELIADPAHTQLNKLIQEAQLNILPTFMETGIKLKLVNALYKGRFCVVNAAMINHTGLEKYCSVAQNDAEMKNGVIELFQKQFTKEDFLFRKNIEQEFSDLHEVNKIIGLL